jgi:hypothetical protein
MPVSVIPYGFKSFRELRVRVDPDSFRFDGHGYVADIEVLGEWIEPGPTEADSGE